MRCLAAPSEPVPACIEFAATGEKFAVEWRKGPRRRALPDADRIAVQAPDERGARATAAGAGSSGRPMNAWRRGCCIWPDESNYSVSRVVHPLPADTLGELLDARHRELELLAGVPEDGGRALFVRSRIGSHPTYESFSQFLAPGRENGTGLPAPGSGIAGELAHRARLGVQDLSIRETVPEPKPFVDLSDEQVHWDLGESLSYSQYLNLDKLLGAQHPLSYQHDEMLFIVIHQVSELWMKLCLHELGATVDCVRRDDLGPTFKMLARVSTIQQQLLQSWDVLATITPSRLFGLPQHPGKILGFPIAPVPNARIPHRQQERRHHQGIPRRSAHVRDAGARVAGPQPLR